MLDVSQYILVKVDKDIDAAYVVHLRHELNKTVDVSCNHIIIDLSKVSYIDSTGIAMILSLARYLARAGGLLVMVNACELVYHSFEVAGITQMLPITTKPQEKKELPPLSKAAEPTQLLCCSFNASSMLEARQKLQAVLAKTSLSKPKAADVLLAVGEALGNVVLHTAKQRGCLEVLAYRDRIISLVSDEGSGFSLKDGKRAHVTLEHGRGIKMMEMLLDDVSVSNTAEGACVSLTKLLS